MYLNGKTSVKQKDGMVLVEIIEDNLIKTEFGEFITLNKRLNKLLTPITPQSAKKYQELKNINLKNKLRNSIKKNIYQNNLSLKKIREILYLSEK